MYTLTNCEAAAAPRKALQDASLTVSVDSDKSRDIQNVPWFNDETPACPNNTGTHERQITLHRDL